TAFETLVARLCLGAMRGRASHAARAQAEPGHEELRLLGGDDNVNAAAVTVERHHAIGQGEKRIVLGPANVATGVVLRAALTNDDATRPDGGAAINLDAEPLAIRFTAVPYRALPLLMSHRYLLA